MVRNLKNQSGFTLVELLVVVAIIGILASAGIPQYRRMVGKSKTAEAKVALGEVANAESAFFAEFGGFGNNLRSMGVQAETATPAQVAAKNYVFGFFTNAGVAAAAVVPSNPAPALGDTVQQAITNSNIQYYTGVGMGAGVGTSDSNLSSFVFGKVTMDCASCAGAKFPTLTAIPATYNSYQAGAAGIIMSGFNTVTGAALDGGAAATTDHWTVDQARNIVNTQSGIGR